MKNILNLKNNISFILTLALLMSFSCSTNDNDSSVGKLSMSANAKFTNLTTNSSSSRVMNSNIAIEVFKMNLREFELELDIEDDDHQDDQDEQWDDDGYFDYQDEIELEGPFELDLMSGQINFSNVNVPMGVYEELEFKFDASTNALSDLFGKSVLIQGTIDGTPFIFWHNFEDEVEVDFEDPQFDITISQNVQGIVINFDLGQILDSVNGVDLTLANDGNNDGIIEISPEDPDGNNDLAEALRHKIKEYIDLIDD